MQRQVVSVLILGALLGAGQAKAQGPEIISIDGFSYNGSGCGPGTVSYDLSPDRLALTLLFSEFQVATDSVSTRSCAINVAMRVPPGWQYAIFALDTRGYADMQAGANGYHAATYRFGSGPMNQLGVDAMSGPYTSDYFKHDEIALTANNWSPCNVAEENLDLNLQMGVAGAGGAQAMMTIDSVDGSLTHHYGIKWRHCPSSDLNRRFVESLYADVLGRWASDAEINGWYQSVIHGAVRATTARGFLTSWEKRTYEIAATYVTMLGRLPSPAEVNGWANAAVAQKLTSDDITVAFATSPEFYAHFGNTPQGAVVGLFRTILQREPSAADVAAWTPLALRDRAGAARAIIGSPESRVKQVARFYAAYLHRPGSPAEWKAWAAGMRQHDAQEQVQSQIIGSAEYYTMPR